MTHKRCKRRDKCEDWTKYNYFKGEISNLRIQVKGYIRYIWT